MKPNYMVIGSAKSGTTSLCATLGQHPEIFITEPKEPRFFSWDERYARGVEWYESLYDAAGDKPARGEGSQSYSVSKVFPDTARRIAEYAPDLKLIYIVRHPLQKIESIWLEVRSWDYGTLKRFLRNTGGDLGMADISFSAAIRQHPDGFVDSANYLRELEVYRQYYSDDRILVLFFDDFKADSQAVLRKCFEFLGVDPTVKIEQRRTGHLNSSLQKRVPGPGLSRLMKVPGYGLVWKAIPQTVRQWGKSLLRVPVTKKPEWKPEDRQWVLDRLASDTETFLEQQGRPRDFWNLGLPTTP